MKFNPRSIRSWLTYLVAGGNLLLAILASMLTPKRRDRRIRVVLYGHHFYGNLRAFFDHADWASSNFDCRFIYLDYSQYRKYRTIWPGLLSAFRPDHMYWVARADILIADRGLGIFPILLRARPRIRTVQVWHGVGYKGFGPTVRTLRAFSLVLAPSDAVKDEWHADGDGPPIERIRVTGFARTDPLINPRHTRTQLERLLDLELGKPRVLFAPTWKHDVDERPVVPLGIDSAEFFSRLDDWAQRADIEVVFRLHLNTTSLQRGDELRYLQPHGLANIRFRSMGDYPLTEHLLMVSDVLVADWSSISTDYLVLDRPLVFLDVPAPFKYGWSVLDAGDRPGPVVSAFDDLLEALDEALQDPTAQVGRYERERQRVKAKAFDNTLDGESSQRYLDEIVAMLGEER